ncbi:hypothetical protein J1614_007575 [Plenodomus biglobosus]|nr:hypothetical protein J1614_007575 [Plenodomus biglobosus]
MISRVSRELAAVASTRYATPQAEDDGGLSLLADGAIADSTNILMIPGRSHDYDSVCIGIIPNVQATQQPLASVPKRPQVSDLYRPLPLPLR